MSESCRRESNGASMKVLAPADTFATEALLKVKGWMDAGGSAEIQKATTQGSGKWGTMPRDREPAWDQGHL